MDGGVTIACPMFYPQSIFTIVFADTAIIIIVERLVFLLDLAKNLKLDKALIQYW